MAQYIANMPDDIAGQVETSAGGQRSWLDYVATRDQWLLAAVSIVVVLVLGVIDNITGGLRLAFAVVYALPIAFGTWFISARFGVVLLFLSVLAWLAGDLIAGVEWASPLVPVWNAFVRIAYYLSIVVLLTTLRDLQETLEERVRERTAALTRALGERRELEQELLEISDSEQRRIGSDLHDTLSQHLAGTALACAVLAKRLDAKDPQDAEQAKKIVKLVEEGTVLSRNVAKGLNPVELFDEGLMFALRDFASNTSKLFGVECRFVCDYPVLFDTPSVTVQLFRIAQEAATNAAKHGKATEIVIELNADEDSVILTVSDNGIGIPQPLPSGSGMGLRIMGHRANLIGVTLQIVPRSDKGTIVTCVLPQDSVLKELQDD
jgi:signal transduction histidine kinase